MRETSSASYLDERVRSPEDQEGCKNFQIKRAEASHSTDALQQLGFVQALSVLSCSLTSGNYGRGSRLSDDTIHSTQ